MEKIDGLLFIDIDLFVMSYFLKLWFKVQFVEWEKYNQENLVKKPAGNCLCGGSVTYTIF